ncbi:MAG: outer membrane beta-barrel protein, partial [Sulfurihydrogenibium sp.]
MKKVVGLAAAGLLAVSTAKAGQITVANTDITMFGGVSAAYSVNNTDHGLAGGGFSKDRFSVNNVIIGLTKPAQDGGIGFTAAFGMFEAPTV